MLTTSDAGSGRMSIFLSRGVSSARILRGHANHKILYTKRCARFRGSRPSPG